MLSQMALQRGGTATPEGGSAATPVDAVLERSSWRPAPIFDLVARVGRIEPAACERTFHMGVGMVAVLPPAAVEPALALLAERELPAWVLGEIVAGSGTARLVGAHSS